MENLNSRVLHLACREGVLDDTSGLEVGAIARRLSPRLYPEPAGGPVEVESALREVRRAYRVAVYGARAVWQGKRPKVQVLHRVARRLRGDEQAADALLSEAILASKLS